MAGSAWRLAPLALAAVLLLFAPAALAQSWECREVPGAAHVGCGLPYNMSNFQSYYACDSSVVVSRPTNVSSVQRLVAEASRVQGVGTGHSWNAGEFCPPASTGGSTHAGVVMTEIDPVLRQIQNPRLPSYFGSAAAIPADFPIQVDEEAATVTVQAGIPQRVLLDYLAGYTIGSEPQGWTLGAFAWFLDQTIAGAVATNTHGSSLRYGSLSSQVRSMRVVLANGTVYNASRDEDAHLFRALGVSVGRLGVITELTMDIVPQKTVAKTVASRTWDAFVADMQEFQASYLAALASGDYDAVQEAIAPLNERQVFWHPYSRAVNQVDFSYDGKNDEDVILNLAGAQVPDTGANDEAVSVSAASLTPVNESTPVPSLYAQRFSSSVEPNRAETANPGLWDVFYRNMLRTYLTSYTGPSRDAFLSQTEFTTLTINYAPYDQYEVAVPFDVIGDCLGNLTEVFYGDAALYDGFRTPALIRFVSGEDFYLAYTNGGPRVFFNIEDFVTKSSGTRNQQFYDTVEFFLNKCDARLHFGKAGWPEHLACFDGPTHYGDSWCDFGCAVDQLDPESKFNPETDLWQFHATKAGQSVEFSSCCTAEGFSSDCQCASRTDCS